MQRVRDVVDEDFGFTLIELLIVIGLVAALAGIALGAARGGREQALANRARAELALIGAMIEDYRREFGEFPQTADTPEKLFDALHGRLGPDGTAMSGWRDIGSAGIALRDSEESTATNCFVDPWGRAYQYIYYVRDAGADDLTRGFVLFSLGSRAERELLPTRVEVVPKVSGPAGGEIARTERNAANIYFSR